MKKKATLYRVEYYKKLTKWQHERGKMFVFSETEQEALDHVREEAGDFLGFPEENVSANTITEIDYHVA
jgi:hypothetical protein